MNATQNGFRHKERLLSRRQLTSVMDEMAPATIQHANILRAMQDKIRDLDQQITKINTRLEMDMRSRYRLYRTLGCSRLVSLWRAL